MLCCFFSIPFLPTPTFFFCTLRQMFFSPRVESCPKTGPHTPPPPQARAAPAPRPPRRGGRGRRGRAHSFQPEGWPLSAPPLLSFWTRWVGVREGRTPRTSARSREAFPQQRLGRSRGERRRRQALGTPGRAEWSGPRRGPAPPPARPRHSLPQHLAKRSAPSRLQRGLCRAGLALGQAPKQ